MLIKEYIKEGLKLTHPTGVVQLLNIEDLTRLKNRKEQHKANIETDIIGINGHIAELQKIVKGF